MEQKTKTSDNWYLITGILGLAAILTGVVAATIETIELGKSEK